MTKINKGDYVVHSELTFEEYMKFVEDAKASGFKPYDEYWNTRFDEYTITGVNFYTHNLEGFTHDCECNKNNITHLYTNQFKERIGMPDAGQFTKADLKDGMVVTLRDGRQGIVFESYIYLIEIDHNGLNEVRGRRISHVDDYTHELLVGEYFDGHEQYDIVKVEYMGETIWQREPEKCPKQKQLDELYRQIDEMRDKTQQLQAMADMIRGG